MTPERSWDIQLDKIPTPQTTNDEIFQNTVLLIKNLFVGSGYWTVVASSNGVDPADTSDLWLDAGDIVRNTAGFNHSWVHLQGPPGKFLGGSGRMHVLIDCDRAAFTNFSIRRAHTAFSGGTTTNAPTQAQSLDRDNQQFLVSLSPHRVHAWFSDWGDYVVCVSQDGTGEGEWLGVNLVMKNPEESGGVDHGYPIFGGASGTANVFGLTNWHSKDGQWTSTGVARTGLSLTPLRLLIPCSNGETAYANAGASGDDIDGLFPSIHMLCASEDGSANTVYLGDFPDDIQMTQGAPNLTEEPTSDPLTRLIIGNVKLPFPTGTTLPVL